MAGIAHLLAATFLRIFPPKEMGSSISREDQDEDEEIENPVPVVHPTEHTPLLHDATPTPKPDIPIESHQTIGQLLSDADFWLLALTMLLLLGSCEMFMANVGTMVLGVPVNRDEATTGGGYSFGSMIRRLGGGVGGGGGGAAQVRLLSFSNTCARLFVGPLADYLAPAPLAHPHGGIHFPRKRYTTRILFLSVSCGLMVAAFCWMAAGVISQEDIYFVSIATGVAYGVTFTVTPSMVAAFWLGPSAGRNYGIVTYAPFIGTPIFSYLYAWISSSHQIDENTVCTGTRCWRTTFWITTVTSSVALILSLILARRRRDRI
ncbi:putative monocarboxylate transporter mch1 [Serendipita sp. 399]|nr:putative monocarboxylate transporter mch1 [Serendipita sp. 399]